MTGDEVRAFLDTMTPADKRIVLTMIREIMACIKRQEQDMIASPVILYVHPASASMTSIGLSE